MFGSERYRIVPYMVLLSGFYTFLIIFCYRLGLGIFILTTVVTSLISYIWIMASMRLKFGSLITDRMDVVANLLIFYFVTFLIIFLSFAFSGIPLNIITIPVSISPVFVWTGIWMHYFRKQLRL